MKRRLPVFATYLAAGLLQAGGLQGPVTVVDKDGKVRESLKDVAAFLEAIQAPRGSVARQPLLKVKTQGKRFVPRVAITTPGSEVSFPNQDHIIHNVFSLSGANRFDTGHYEPGDSPRWTTKAPGLVKLYCNVHHKMNAFLWVVETPFYQVLDGKSGVDFRDVPAGTYRLRLWHPETGDKTWTVTIGEGTTAGRWELSATLPAFEPHTNKFGKPYPPAADEGSY
jgi:plastocyanin